MCCCLYLFWNPPRFSLHISVLLYWVHICLQCLSWWISPFSVMNYPSVSLFMAFVLKSILSDISIATPAFFFCPFTWNIFFYPLTFSLCRSFFLRWVSCRQHMCGSCFLIHSATLCLLIGAFNPFTFKVIDKYLFIAILLPLYLCSSLSHSFSSFS